MRADLDILALSNLSVQDLMAFEQGPNQFDFLGLIRKMISAYGFQNAVYYSPTLPGRATDDPFSVCTYETEWVQHYFRCKYPLIDPVVHVGARSLLPVDWSGLKGDNPKVIKLFDESREAGVGYQGITVPIRGSENGVWGLFSVTSNEKDTEWRVRRRQFIGDLVLIANFVHQKAYELNASRECVDLNAITRRETEALAWTSEGKTVADVAVLMNISEETVKAHLDSARFKLGALNRVHSVAKAIRHGIIR